MINRETFHAQHGEDRVLSELFGGRTHGVCVEIGGSDGVSLSNTFYFEKLGWKCIVAEPIAELAAQIRENRNCLLHEVAVSNRNGYTEFAVARGIDVLSAIDPTPEHIQRIENEGGSIETISVPCVTMNELLAASDVAAIDFVTIDVEGHEMQVLRGFSLDKYKPRILIIEDNTMGMDKTIPDYLKALGYIKFYRTGCNEWYSHQNDPFLAKPIIKSWLRSERRKLRLECRKKWTLRLWKNVPEPLKRAIRVPLRAYRRMRSNLLQQKFICYSEKDMIHIKRKNRQSLNKIETWVNQGAFDSSYYNYGVPDLAVGLLDKTVGDETTYSDIMLYCSKALGPVNYLEIGVSVGKNFYQMAEGLETSQLTGFDIEEIHPVLKEQFAQKEVIKIGQPHEGSLRKQPPTVSTYSYNSNSITYLAADIWDENAWAKLHGQKFNLIFSDALHIEEALIWEYEMIKKYKLLDNDFIFMWDDLSCGLEKSLAKIALDLQHTTGLLKKHCKIGQVNGWLGTNEPAHNVGFIASNAVSERIRRGKFC